MKQLTVHLDAVVIIALIFLASLGMNAWQFLNNRELMQKYIDTEWELGNTRANAAYARRLLKTCDTGKHDDLDAGPYVRGVPPVTRDWQETLYAGVLPVTGS